MSHCRPLIVRRPPFSATDTSRDVVLLLLMTVRRRSEFSGLLGGLIACGTTIGMGNPNSESYWSVLVSDKPPKDGRIHRGLSSRMKSLSQANRNAPLIEHIPDSQLE
jgi:hypothetical protein